MRLNAQDPIIQGPKNVLCDEFKAVFPNLGLTCMVLLDGEWKRSLKIFIECMSEVHQSGPSDSWSTKPLSEQFLLRADKNPILRLGLSYRKSERVEELNN